MPNARAIAYAFFSAYLITERSAHGNTDFKANYRTHYCPDFGSLGHSIPEWRTDCCANTDTFGPADARTNDIAYLFAYSGSDSFADDRDAFLRPYRLQLRDARGSRPWLLHVLDERGR